MLLGAYGSFTPAFAFQVLNTPRLGEVDGAFKPSRLLLPTANLATADTNHFHPSDNFTDVQNFLC